MEAGGGGRLRGSKDGGRRSRVRESEERARGWLSLLLLSSWSWHWRRRRRCRGPAPGGRQEVVCVRLASLRHAMGMAAGASVTTTWCSGGPPRWRCHIGERRAPVTWPSAPRPRWDQQPHESQITYNLSNCTPSHAPQHVAHPLTLRPHHLRLRRPLPSRAMTRPAATATTRPTWPKRRWRAPRPRCRRPCRTRERGSTSRWGPR